MPRQQRFQIILVAFLILFFISVPYVFGAPLTGTLTKISVGIPTAYPFEPALSGNSVVWRDDRTGVNNIYLYDIATGIERQLTKSTGLEEKPAISGHFVVWQDTLFSGAGNGYDIVLYDLDTGISTRIANTTGDQTDPSIDGDIVVWQDRRNGVNADIYLYSISAGTETQVSSAEGDQLLPRVSGNIIVWENNTFWPRTIEMYDYAGNRTPFQPVLLGSDADQARPSIRNTYLVWSDNHQDLTYYHVYREDITTGEIVDITPDDNDHMFPETDSTRVVWIENGDIFLNDTAIPESETQITLTYGATVKDNLRISGDRIVWWESDGARNMVNLFSIGSEETCPVASFTIQPSQSGAVPFTVSFTDTSANPAGNPISHWNWDFGEGNHSTIQNPVWTYERPGNFDVILTVDNHVCRNSTDIGPGYRITAGAAPVSGISASTLSGMVPLTVTFTDTSAAATSWNWSFGDGLYAETNPATHTFTSGGTYTVRLEDENEWGHSHTTTIIHALTGANENANTAIEGFFVVNRFSGQFLVYNGTTLPGYSQPVPSVLISPPLPDYGWQNITFRSSDGIGFHNFGNETIMGNLSGVILQSTEKNPSGFSAATGSQSSVSYILDLPAYPVGGTINTKIWEGALPMELTEFRNISQGSGWSHVLDISYTIKNTLTQFSPSGPAKLYVSVNSTWVANHEGRNQTFLVRIGDDGYGQVLPTRFLYNDTATNLDYFEADSPRGLSTFGLSQLQGSGNPLQLITLSATQIVSPPSQTNTNPSSDSDSDSSGGGGGGAGTVKVAVKTAIPTSTPTARPTEDPGKKAKIYTNANGLVSQATRLASTDGRAVLMVKEGVVAKDAAGNPLPDITIKALPAGSFPPVPAGSSYSFAGMAYGIGPDGTTFSPPISLSFTVPQAQWGQDYTVKWFDGKSGTWQDLPTTFTATTGTVTADISHLCVVALFREPRAVPSPTPAGTPLPLPSAALIRDQPPSSAVSIFTGMLAWAATLLMHNVVPLVGVIFLGIAGYLVLQGRFPGSGQ